MKKTKEWITKNVLYFAWIVAIMGFLGSLYFSEILGYAPCVLCWYQRILLYPLVILLAIGIGKKDKHISTYVLPFSIGGMLLAFYHELLQTGVIPEGFEKCSFGVSCTTKYIELFHFITIPLMSFLAFSFITVCMFIFNKFTKKTL